jgi:hypothetical protein
MNNERTIWEEIRDWEEKAELARREGRFLDERVANKHADALLDCVTDAERAEWLRG